MIHFNHYIKHKKIYSSVGDSDYSCKELINYYLFNDLHYLLLITYYNTYLLLLFNLIFVLVIIYYYSI